MEKISSKHFLVGLVIGFMIGIAALFSAVNKLGNITFETVISRGRNLPDITAAPNYPGIPSCVLNPDGTTSGTCPSPNPKKRACRMAWNIFCKNPQIRNACAQFPGVAGNLLDTLQVCVNGIPQISDGCEFTTANLPDCLNNPRTSNDERDTIINAIRQENITPVISLLSGGGSSGGSTCNTPRGKISLARFFLTLPADVQNAFKVFEDFIKTNPGFLDTINGFEAENPGCLNCIIGGACI